ncbi:putative tail sheath protein [Vibrio phage 501E54-1]|nr:putative tail sheath protein [Vibrio phage 501E54-1]
MPFLAPVAVNTREATASASVADLNRAMLISTHAYWEPRLASFSSMTEVNDSAIPKDSVTYAALQEAFSGNASSRSLPIYVGRHEIDSIVLTPVVADSEDYTFSISVINTTTGAETVAETEITFSSDTSATGTEITAGLETEMGTASIAASEVVTADTATTLTLTPATDRAIFVTKRSENLVETFTATETAANCFAAIQAEENEAWYFTCTTVRDDDWIMGLCDAVEATESSDFPKQFRVSSNDASTLVAQTDPSASADLLGRMEDASLNNCHGEWHDQSDVIFPELAACVYNGGFFTGTQNWTGMNGCSVPPARHPVLGRLLTTGEIGFINDRNAFVRGKYMGLDYYFSGNKGTLAKGQGAWVDNLQISHWVRLTMKQRVFTALVNQGNAGVPLNFTKAKRNIIKERCESVLNEAVTREMLLGHTGVTVPDNISFADQAERTLKDIVFTGYFAGKINHIIVDGILTYSEEL